MRMVVVYDGEKLSVTGDTIKNPRSGALGKKDENFSTCFFRLYKDTEKVLNALNFELDKRFFEDLESERVAEFKSKRSEELALVNSHDEQAQDVESGEHGY
jgi:hypothetical protein